MALSFSDASNIDCISKIDLSKGFTHFHVKWPLKNLTRPKYSSDMRTIFGGKKVTLPWSLIIKDSPKNPTKTWFGAGLATFGMITPIIFRIRLSSSTKVLFDQSGLAVFSRTVGYGHVVPSSQVDAFPIDDLVLHFWIDFPNATVVNKDMDLTWILDEAYRIKAAANNNVFLSDTSKIFSHVVGTNTDPSTDVSIVIINKDEEEQRQFRCHTVFLSGRSEFFERLFASEEWKEKCMTNDRSVKINDVSVQVMEMVLRYIYTSVLPDSSIDHDHLCGVIFAADKYNLDELKNWCAGVLIFKHASIKSRIEQLILADRHKLVQLKTVCVDQLSLSFAAFSDPATLGDIPSHLLSEIVKALADRQVRTTDSTVSTIGFWGKMMSVLSRMEQEFALLFSD